MAPKIFKNSSFLAVQHLDVDRTLIPRERNLYFTYQQLGAVGRSLIRLSERLQLSWSVDELNAEILRSFYEHGRPNRGHISTPRQEPWMMFLSDDELEVSN
jgi:hypothetical protein